MDHFTTFVPGENIDSLGLKREANRELSGISLMFPSRIHMTPIDCNRFGFGKPGGGGIGFAVDLPNQLNISISSEAKIESNSAKHRALVIHYFKLVQAVLKTELSFHFELNLHDMMTQHFGLGSSICVACATVFGLNKILGSPLSIEEIRSLVAYNFVEEYMGEVTRGLETGVGSSVILRGGISVVGNEIVEVFHRPFPEGYSILLIDPKTTRPNSEQPESEAMLRRTFFLDASYRYIKAYDVLMDIIPALHSGDIKKFGMYIWDIQFSGTHLSMIQTYENYGKKIYDILGFLKKNGADVCGLSSVGPLIYAICETSTKEVLFEELKIYREKIGIREINPNNNGIRTIKSFK
jgi:beta-ribofuranosylaminobenzene 5'-phosphate synthase